MNSETEASSLSLMQLNTNKDESQNTSLMILKIGDIRCEEHYFERFIVEGFVTCKQLRYLYFTSDVFHQHQLINTVNQDRIGEYVKGKDHYLRYYENVKQIHINEFTKRNNAENGKLPKIIQATAEHTSVYDNENLLTLFDDIILARSIDNNNKYEQLPITHGEDILQLLINEGNSLTNFESMIFLFEQIFDPDTILERFQLSAFHLFALYGHTNALDYTLKLGTNIN